MTMTTLRPLAPSDLDACHRLSVQLSWPHRREDWEFLLGLGQGFVAVDAAEVVGCGLWWAFGQDHARLGMILVAPERQGMGIGKLLTAELLAAAGERSLMLIATPEGEPLYAKSGFVATGEIRQHQGGWPEIAAPVLPPDTMLRPATASDLPLLAKLDREATGLPRAHLIEALLPRGHALVLERAGDAVGFGFLRQHGRGWLIGPVTASDDAAACNLIAALLAGHRGEFVRIDVHARTGLGAWLAELGLPLVASGVAMVRGLQPVGPGPAHPFALVNQAMG